MHPDSLVLHPDASLLGHVVGQAPKRPQRERQPQAARTAPDRMHQHLTILHAHLARRSRMRLIAQAFDSLGQVALEPPPYRLLTCAHYLCDLCCGQALLGGQKNHLGARSQPSVAGGAVQLLQRLELLRAEGRDTNRFHGLLSTHKITPLKIYLFVLRVVQQAHYQGPRTLLLAFRLFVSLFTEVPRR